ncbi:MAG TPA: phosphoribosyltransferase [Holophagaceae bacterium]|jgi:putative phosphoribosyl transferase|nr:phosphoribosyltransferase [Holophagaceae bacterium]
MPRRFKDRIEAGRLLGEALKAYAGRGDVTVLGLPRGGVPVAAEVARALGASMDVCLVRKLGAPGHEELAMGAIASGGVRVLNEDVIRSLGISARALEAEAAREGAELARRERLYRGGRPPLDVRGRTAILVDDGVATGATMLAAVRALRQMGPAAILIAVPVAPPSTLAELEREADGTICLLPEESLIAVGYWYEDFSQTTDGEVQACLAPVPK